MAAFDVNQSTGVITVTDSSLLDFEVKKTFTINVRVTDSGVPAESDEATITINLIDRADQPRC